MHGDDNNSSDNVSWESSLGDVLDDDFDSDEEPISATRRRIDEKRQTSTSRLASSSAAAIAATKTSSPRRLPVSIPVVLDLAPIDDAFGPKSDLYRDVLGVKPNASPEQIQKSYFQRRNELFKLLSDLDADEADTNERMSSRSSSAAVTATKRSNAERKMDGVVMAMRILGDPDLRAKYDDVRADRLRGRNVSPIRPQKVVVTSSEYHAKETIRVETTTHKKKTAVEPTSTTATTRKKPDNESPPSSPPQPPKKKQQQRQQREEEHVVTAAANKQPNTKFYRRIVPVLDRSSRAASAAAATPTRATGKGRPVAVSPEKPVNRKTDSNKKVADSAVASSARWPQSQQPKPSSFTKAGAAAKTTSTKATVPNKERGIRFDMDRREYPAPKADAYYDDTEDDTTADVNWTDEGTMVSEDPSETTLTTAAASAALREEEKKKGFVARVSDELCGAIEDTAASFDQVFNVFTLQDEDIRAVRYRIDKFRQQVSHSL